ncbi:type IV pilin-like G/H family protein [Coleofasciculus sp. FACHB-501]|uniref:protein kinase domain-containing protein n=1 Tax=Cyanophyceae TaxID=3028117 RepID=UPI00168859C1|nr:type IV pilin-like G/H family protein [Coleofasciculus sp. FACHB-501]MBD1839398.1 protein kinase [Coleofasciculus sp. FACHB-501]
MLQAEKILQGHYHLTQQLGQNAGRKTWLAEDLEAEPSESVIVKLLAFSPQMQWEELKLFEREAQVLKNLNHPRIPTYRDYFSLDEQAGGGLPWFGLVQDYIPGSSLRQLLDKGKKFTPEQVRYVATDILEILIYLHELSPPVLHRDIKPSNIILGEDRQFYLVDFGAVQDRAKAEGVTFTVVGTSGYAPPEQLWGRAVPASDLYALGATLIHLLTGTPPSELPQHQMRIQFSDKVSLNPNFSSWIEKLIEPAPEKRFSTAREALEALQQVESFKSSDSETEAQANGNSVRYGRLALSTALPLFTFMALIAAIALPSFFTKRAIIEKSEARQSVGTMNRGQKAYFIENNEFSNSVEKLGIGMKTQKGNYEYATRVLASKAAFNYAIPHRNNKSYVGGVFIVPAKSSDAVKGKMKTIAILCESNAVGATKLPEPIYNNGKPACPAGTLEIPKEQIGR